MFKPAEPTLDRLERFYGLVHDLSDEVSVREPEPESSGLRPTSIAEQAKASQKPPVRLDSAALCQALFQRGRLREMACIVLVHESGRDLTDEEAGTVSPAALRSAIPFYLLGLAELLSTFAGSESDGVSLTEMGAETSDWTMPSGISASA